MTKKLQKRPTLAEKTRDLLINRPRTMTLTIIAYEIDCSENWLSMFLNERIQDPSVNTIQRLYEMLSGKFLEY